MNDTLLFKAASNKTWLSKFMCSIAYKFEARILKIYRFRQDYKAIR